jgi:hypothetical protein
MAPLRWVVCVGGWMCREGFCSGGGSGVATVWTVLCTFPVSLSELALLSVVLHCVCVLFRTSPPQYRNI